MTNRVLLGRRSNTDSTVGLWIAKQNFDTSDSNVDNFLIHPLKNDLLPVFTSYVTHLPFISSSQGPILENNQHRYYNRYDLNIPHGQSHIPIVISSEYNRNSMIVGVDSANILIQLFTFIYVPIGSPNNTNPFTLLAPISLVVMRLIG